MRTQSSLTEQERPVLDVAAAWTGRSLPALIRDAIEHVYGSERSTEDDLAATAVHTDAEQPTPNIRHFPRFADLQAPHRRPCVTTRPV